MIKYFYITLRGLNMSHEEIIYNLCGEDELSPKFIDLLKSYDLTENDGLEIKETLIEESKYIEGKDDIMRSFVGEIVILYRKNHKETFNPDKLASYVTDDDMWNQAIDRIKTINILEENYIGIWPELSDIYLKDLVKFNLLGKYASIHFSLFNFPSKDLEGKNVREYCIEHFKKYDLRDEIDEKHPKSIKEAVYCLIKNLDIEYLDRIKEMEKDGYSLYEHFSLGMWIRNEFGINKGVNSQLLYDCYCSEYNDRRYLKAAVLFTPDSVSDIILKALWDEVDKNYDKIKDYDFTSKIDRRKYRLDDLEDF